MDVFHCDDLDVSVVNELIDDINDHYLNSEDALIQLDRAPSDKALLSSLFSSVHTMKGDLSVVGFSPVLPLISSVEEILVKLRDGSIEFTPMLSDVVLLVLDKIREFVASLKSQNFVEYSNRELINLSSQINSIVAGLSRANSANVDKHRVLQEEMAAVIRVLDPSVSVANNRGFDESRVYQDDYLTELGLDRDHDLDFFRDLMEPIEKRSEFWQGRGDRILKMSLALNKQGGHAVDERQLAAAVYVHDFGMAFMPLELLHKKHRLDNTEVALLQSHIQSSAHLLQNMEQWKTAREIVLQHHEAANGTGYPYGLRDNDICDGAKILSIADTFEALTHQRAYATHQKRPIIRAVKEINDCSGKQLSEHWVELFNQVVQSILSTHQSRQL